MLLIPLVFVLVYYCYLSQLYATLCGYVNRPLGPLYIVIPCVNIIKDAKPIGFTVYHGIRRLIWSCTLSPASAFPPLAPRARLASCARLALRAPRRRVPPRRTAVARPSSAAARAPSPLLSMAAPPSGGSSSSAPAAAAAAKLRDEALAAAKTLEEEVVSLRITNSERSQQLQEESDLLKSAAAAQERVRAAATALDQERA